MSENLPTEGDLVAAYGFMMASASGPGAHSPQAERAIQEIKRQARREALREAVAVHRAMHTVYGSTAVCHGGIGGAAMTPHCAAICNNPRAPHRAEVEAWRLLEAEAMGEGD